jgi:hypothetical protein
MSSKRFCKDSNRSYLGGVLVRFNEDEINLMLDCGDWDNFLFECRLRHYNLLNICEDLFKYTIDHFICSKGNDPREICLDLSSISLVCKKFYNFIGLSRVYVNCRSMIVATVGFTHYHYKSSLYLDNYAIFPLLCRLFDKIISRSLIPCIDAYTKVNIIYKEHKSQFRVYICPIHSLKVSPSFIIDNYMNIYIYKCKRSSYVRLLDLLYANCWCENEYSWNELVETYLIGNSNLITYLNYALEKNCKLEHFIRDLEIYGCNNLL